MPNAIQSCYQCLFFLPTVRHMRSASETRPFAYAAAWLLLRSLLPGVQSKGRARKEDPVIGVQRLWLPRRRVPSGRR